MLIFTGNLYFPLLCSVWANISSIFLLNDFHPIKKVLKSWIHIFCVIVKKTVKNTLLTLDNIQHGLIYWQFLRVRWMVLFDCYQSSTIQLTALLNVSQRIFLVYCHLSYFTAFIENVKCQTISTTILLFYL